MNKEEKIKFVRELHKKSGLKDFSIEISRDDEINADYVYVLNMRGLGGLIIGNDGTFIFCQSAHGYEYCKAEYKKGVRNNKWIFASFILAQ